MMKPNHPPQLSPGLLLHVRLFFFNHPFSQRLPYIHYFRWDVPRESSPDFPMETHRMFGSPSGKVVATLVVSPQDVIQPTQDHSFLTAAWMKIQNPS